MNEAIPIFLSSDNNYAPFVATTMASILDNTKDFINFYILDGNISEINRSKICGLKRLFLNFSVEFINVEYEKFFRDFKVTERINKSMYSRFLIPFLKTEVDKAIYSDVDVIVLDNIKKMYNEKLEGYIIGGVEEKHLTIKEMQDRINRLSLSHDCNYFASGNLLIDCKKWREENITEKLLKTTIALNDRLLLPDMDVLNIVFDKKAKMLSQKYCWTNRKYMFYKDIKEKIVIRHFEGAIKPWDFAPNVKENRGLIRMRDKNLFWKYARMTNFYDDLVQNVKYETEDDIRKLFVKEIIKNKNRI